MQKLLNVKKNLRKNGRKGFTLIELIVVIVIIAILVAALTPAILGVIDRANRSADEADARSVLMAATVVTTLTNPPAIPNQTDFTNRIQAQFNGSLKSGMRFRIGFRSNIAVSCYVIGGGRSSGSIYNPTSSTTGVIIGENPPPNDGIANVSSGGNINYTEFLVP